MHRSYLFVLTIHLIACKPDRASECARTYEIGCVCWDVCSDTGEVHAACTDPELARQPTTAEEWQCYNDQLLESCDQGAAFESCGM